MNKEPFAQKPDTGLIFAYSNRFYALSHVTNESENDNNNNNGKKTAPPKHIF